MTEYDVLDTSKQLAAAAATLAEGEGPLAVDVERASGYRYSSRAYLVQMYRRGSGTFLFDPPAIGDFDALQDAVGSLEWVFHAADQDLPSLAEIGLRPPRIFDTELASRLLGHEHVGLGAVVEDTLGVHLAKAHSAADWSTRPLPQPWLEYAALDVAYLIDVRDALCEELRGQKKESIADQEFAAILTRPPKPARAEPWRRLSGLHSVHGRRGIAIARELWEARDAYAREQDVSPGRLVPDRGLVAAVRAKPTSKAELAAVKEFTGRASRSQLDRWWAAIERGRARTDLPSERASGHAVPPARAWRERNPEADARLRTARAALQEHADDLHMPVENLLTPAVLREVAWEPPAQVDADSIADALTRQGARPWQVEHTAQRVATAFVDSAQSIAEDPPADS